MEFKLDKGVGYMYCYNPSHHCATKSTRKFEVSKETLGKLLWEYPTTHISKMFGVSDKAIEKRAKKFGLSKPPRGYWAKLSSGNV